MKKFQTIAFMFSFFLVLLLGLKAANIVDATGKPAGTEHCEGWDQKSIPEGDTGTFNPDGSVTHTAPSGKVVSEVCVKRGNTHTPWFTNSNPGECYEVAGIDTNEITVSKNETGNNDQNCKDISHLDVKYETPEICVETVTCSDSCRADDVYLEGDCGKVLCESNAPEVESCPTACGYQGGTVSDGECGLIECSATESCQEEPSTPYVTSDKQCGEVTLNFYNPTKWYFTFDYRVDSEGYVADGTSDSWYGLTIKEGPLAGQTFGARWHEVGIAGPGSSTKVLSFNEDSGTHQVEYRLAEGAEQKMYFDWVSIDDIESDCKENEVEPSPTPSPGVGGSSEETKLGVDNLQCPNTSFLAAYDVFNNGNPVENVEVTFTFNGQTAKSKTNSSGRATASFGINDGTLKAEASGYPSQQQHISKLDCPTVVLDPGTEGEVLGASTGGTTTEGRVLGATTLADTGVSDIYLAISSLVSGFVSTAGAIIYGRKK